MSVVNRKGQHSASQSQALQYHSNTIFTHTHGLYMLLNTRMSVIEHYTCDRQNQKCKTNSFDQFSQSGEYVGNDLEH